MGRSKKGKRQAQTHDGPYPPHPMVLRPSCLQDVAPVGHDASQQRGHLQSVQLDYSPPACARQLPSALKAAIDAYVRKWGPLLQAELDEERNLVKERLQSWPDIRLLNEGLMMNRLAARPHGSFFGRTIVKLTGPSPNLPFTRFKAGDLVTLSRYHPLHDKCWEASVLDKSWKEVRLVMDAVPRDVSTGTWRLDTGVDMSLYQRACAALKSLYKSPSSIFRDEDEDDEGPPMMPYYEYEELGSKRPGSSSQHRGRHKGKRYRQQDEGEDLPPGTGILDVLLREGGAGPAAQPSGLMPVQAIRWAQQQLNKEMVREEWSAAGQAGWAAPSQQQQWQPVVPPVLPWQQQQQWSDGMPPIIPPPPMPPLAPFNPPSPLSPRPPFMVSPPHMPMMQSQPGQQAGNAMQQQQPAPPPPPLPSSTAAGPSTEYQQQQQYQRPNVQASGSGGSTSRTAAFGRGGGGVGPSTSHVGVAVVAPSLAADEDASLGLNRSQVAAVAQCIMNKVTLVHGPPGTGKTSTIVRFLSLLLSKLNLSVPVLVCAQSNVAVDNLLEGLVNQGIRALRMGEAVKVRPELRTATLQARIQDHPLQGAAQTLSQQLTEMYAQLPGLTGMDKGLAHRDISLLGKQMKEVKSEMMTSVLQDAQVICATCVGSGSDMLASCVFPVVVLDEGSQATEPECLIPITKGARHVVLVGDHHQLPPVVKCQEAQQGGLDCSLFERLLTAGVPASLLQVQYRMHPALAAFPNQRFYAGSLVDGVRPEQRPAPAGLPWPTAAPFMVINVQGTELVSAGNSKSNPLEAGVCGRIVTALLKGGLDKSEIGLVTPYIAQVQLLSHQVQLILSKTEQDQQRNQWQWRRDQQQQQPTQGYDEEGGEGVLEVKSVDGYQGREKEVIVFSAVRSNALGQVGFLEDWRRLNVAITRARRGLVLVGHIPTLCFDPHWKALMDHAQASGYVVQASQLRLPGEEVVASSTAPLCV